MNATPWTSVVIGAQRTVAAHGRDMTSFRVPPGEVMDDPGTLLARTAALFSPGADGTLITQWVPDGRWAGTTTNQPELLADFVQRARTAGWHCSDAFQQHQSGWVTFTRDESPAVHMGVLSIMATDTPLFDVTWPPEEIARQLARYADAVGVPYRTAPGVAGCEVIKRWHERTKAATKEGRRECPTWIWKDGLAALQVDHIVCPGDIVWRRRPGADEARQRYVHAYDINKQYLAAMAAVDVPWRAPEHTGADPFDPARAGFWRIIIPRGIRPKVAYSGGIVPTLFDPAKVDSQGRTWATTPIVAAFQRAGYPVRVLDSWLSPYVRRTTHTGLELPGASRWMREPAERIRDALAMHGRPARHKPGHRCPACCLVDTLKQTANSAVGMMAAASSTLRRPDVAATVRDHARAMLLLKIDNAARDHGLYPLQVHRDCVFYASDDPDPNVYAKALGVVFSGQIGRFKIEREKCTTMDVWLTSEPNYRPRTRSRERQATS